MNGRPVIYRTTTTAMEAHVAELRRQGWTLARIGELVRERFGTEYTLAGLDVLLHRLGWSVQVPARRAAERDEAAIAAWREETWPVIKERWRTWVPGCALRTSPARA